MFLPGGVEVAKKNNIQKPRERSGMIDGSGSVAYSGQGCEAVITLRGSSVMANAQYKDGSDFVLEPCAMYKGCHVWKKEDVEHMIDAEDEEVPVETRADELMSSEAKKELIQKGIDDDTTIVYYSIKYY